MANKKVARGDKQVLYNIVRREINNLTAQFPLFNMFGDLIADYVIGLVEPYVAAFMTPGGDLETQQLSAFAAEEAINKINAFKVRFEEERKEQRSNENENR